MSNTSIVVPVVGTFVVHNQPSGINDPAVWRLEDAALPPMYRPTITQTAKSNKLGSNVNCEIKVVVPVVLTDAAGKFSSVDRVIAGATVTALQNVVGTQVEAAYDTLIKALQSQKAAFIAGKTSV